MLNINKYIEVLQILAHENGGLRYLLNGGSSVSSFFVVYQVKHYITSLNTIIDAGANIGQFALAACRFFPSASIYSFEPVPEVFQRLKHNTEHNINIYPVNLALGSEDGDLTFYVNAYSLASSPLQISQNQMTNFPKTALQKEIMVPVRKLDSFDLLRNLKPLTLLKLDVQGYEKEVLCGAKDILKRIDYILLEASFTPMYEGEPLFEEIIYFVNSLDFHLIAPVGILSGIHNQILQMDVLFKKKE